MRKNSLMPAAVSTLLELQIQLRQAVLGENLVTGLNEGLLLVGADLVGTQDAQSRRRDGVIDDGCNGNSAGNGEGNGAARILHLAGHDRGAHEAVPRPEEDGGAGHEFQGTLLESRHKVGRLDVRYREEDEDRQQPDHRQHESDDDLARE